MARAIRRSRIGLKDPKRPVGSFLFLGPTGVGKTELCRALAQTVYGDENAMIRLDMSEYMEKHSVSRLIGSPPGYVGYEDGGQLTESACGASRGRSCCSTRSRRLMRTCASILLQIMDDGHLTDSAGRRVDFRNTVVVMTSNVGAKAITDKKQRLGFGYEPQRSEEEMRRQVMDELKATFRPEFLNRVDETIVFHRLGDSEMLSRTRSMLAELGQRFDKLGVALTVPEDTAKWLAAAGYDENFGARPLRRALQQNIEDAAAELLLDGSIRAGDSLEAVIEDGKPRLKKVV